MMRAVLSVAVGLALVRADDTCQTQTGGACNMVECYSYRNSQCVGSRFCECDPLGARGHGVTCNVGGECVAPGSCPKYTGGTCSWMGCDAARNAQCNGGWGSGYCMCADNLCAHDGNCVPPSSLMLFAANTTVTGDIFLAQHSVDSESDHARKVLATIACFSLFSVVVGAIFLKQRIRESGNEALLSNFVEISD